MSSSFTYTLTKLRSRPSSVYRCFFRSPYRDVSAPSASPTVAPGSSTVLCLSAYCRRAVGIRILAINLLSTRGLRRGDPELFPIRVCLLRVRQKAVGVIEAPPADRKHHERIPRAGVLQIRLGKIRVAVRMRMKNADQIHPLAARLAVGVEQVLRPQLISRRLRAFERVLQLHRCPDRLPVAVDVAQHGPAALVGESRLRMGHHHIPRVFLDLNHSPSSQNGSLRYLSALSQSTVTNTPCSPRSTNSHATVRAAVTFAPDEIPTRMPSSRAMRRTMA